MIGEFHINRVHEKWGDTRLFAGFETSQIMQLWMELEESVRSLEEERAELDDLSGVSEDELDDLASQIEQIRGQKQELDEIISQLQTVIQFNEQLTESRAVCLVYRGSTPAGRRERAR